MPTLAVVFEGPERLALQELELAPRGAADVVVDVEWTGISTGTERLLWSGKMPPFPGLGYPLVPGYETVGRVVETGDAEDGVAQGLVVGDRVFVAGANCFTSVRALFGGSASRLVVPAGRAVVIGSQFAEEAVLLSLAATARHAIASGGAALPELIVGHGVLGRLMARLIVLFGGSPVVWEVNELRRSGACGYRVVDPSEDARRDYRSICDVSGDARLVEGLIARLAKGGELVLAGFYDRIDFGFPLAFMKEARLRIASEFQPDDLRAVVDLAKSGSLSLDGLITHRRAFHEASAAYEIAFRDAACLKMVLDWRTYQ